MPVNQKKVAACLTVSAGLSASLLYRGWHYFGWGTRGPPDLIYFAVVLCFVAAVLGVFTALVRLAVQRRTARPDRARV